MPPPPAARASTSTRLVLLTLLFCTSFVSYSSRLNLSIVAETLMPSVGLSKADMAWVFNSFLFAYALFQVPAGALGDRRGPRIVLSISALAIGTVTILSGLVPGRFGVTLIVLCLLRFLLGSAQAATYPVASEAVARWMPSSHRALGNSVIFMGSSVGSAVSAPLISIAVIHLGWRGALSMSAVPAFLLTIAWLCFKPTRLPHQPGPSRLDDSSQKPWLTLDVCLLSLSYFAEGYLLFMFISWLYIYLVEDRHLSLLAGGIAASLPWITAIVMTPLGGFSADALSSRVGRVRASHIVITTTYLLAGGLLFLAAFTPYRALAILALCLSLGSLYFAEPSFWTTVTVLDSSRSGTIAGFMNAIGVLGGIASNALVPALVARSGWPAAFGSSLATSILTAAVWLVLGQRLSRVQKSA